MEYAWSFKTGGSLCPGDFPTESPEKARGWSLLFSPLPSLSSLSVRVSQLFALDFLEIFQGKGRERNEKAARENIKAGEVCRVH